MTATLESAEQGPGSRPGLRAAIFDVDGVLLASPHEPAWREALEGFADPARFTHQIYEALVAGKPRLAGARAALEAVGVTASAEQVILYAGRKQKRLEQLIHAGAVEAFPDALRFVQALAALRWPMAAASSSKNATAMLQAIQLPSGQSLLEVFNVNESGRDLPRGKPDPAIFLLAAEELNVAPSLCFVAEDAPAGIEAARAGGMVALGLARSGEEALLQAAGANLVVRSFDEISIEELARGYLRRRPG